MMPFNRAFGTCVSIASKTGSPAQKCAVSATQQSLIAISVLFIAIGAAFAGIVGAYIGRRGTIQVGCIVVLIGAGGMLGTSGNFTAYVACKCIQSLGLGQFIGSAPAYGVECMAPRRRGTLTSLFNCGLGMGNLVSAAVCLGSSSYLTNLAWQIPIICQLPLALLLGAGVMFFPESPRWLLLQDREEAARASFAKFYNKDPHDIEISAQVQEVLYDIQVQRERGATTKWTEIFHGTDLRRTLTSILILVGTAITGARFVGIYSTIFLAGVGISNPYAINCIVAACAFIGSLPSPFLIEYGGRRLTLLAGYAGMGTCMLILAAIGTALGAANSTAKSVLIAFLCLWSLVYGSCVGPSLATTAPEMHSVRLRTYGHAFACSVFEVFSFAAVFYTPYMLSVDYGNMGLNIGYFYFGELRQSTPFFATSLTIIYRPYFYSLVACIFLRSRDGRTLIGAN
jgi:MFS family permease